MDCHAPFDAPAISCTNTKKPDSNCHFTYAREVQAVAVVEGARHVLRLANLLPGLEVRDAHRVEIHLYIGRRAEALG
jgi:hypothetical protein